MPLKQVARVLGRSQTAAKATLFRARKKLSAILQGREACAAGVAPVPSAEDRDRPVGPRSGPGARESKHG
jgi:hypothetical protein